MHAADTTLVEATNVARALLGDRAVELSIVQSGGRNSRIWRVRDSDRAFALKQYPSRANDPRDRLSTEVGALRLMERYRIDAVPRVLGVDIKRGYVLLSWIDGREVAEVGDADIDAAVAFLSAIHEMRGTAWAAEQPPASEACLSGAEIERQIDARMTRLRGLGQSRNCLNLLIIPLILRGPRRVAPRARRSPPPALILGMNFRRNGEALCLPISASTTACAGAMARLRLSILSILAGMIR